jgi:hypothetical protein
MAKDVKPKATEAPLTDAKLAEDKTTADYVAARATDGSEGTRYKKIFVEQHKSPSWDKVSAYFDHEPNLVGTLSEALVRGLHPLGEAKFEGAEVQADGVSVELTYSVNVKPVEDNPTGAETLAPSESKHIN